MGRFSEQKAVVDNYFIINPKIVGKSQYYSILLLILACFVMDLLRIMHSAWLNT